MPDHPTSGSLEPAPSKTDGENWLVHLFKAFGYSMAGIGAGLRHEWAFRMEFVAFLLLTPVAIFLPIGLPFKALIIGSMLLVMVVELLNSALESTVDYISLDKHPFAKRAKDMGSAAVLLALVNAGTMWLFALFDWLG